MPRSSSRLSDRSIERHLVLPGAVLELPVVELHDDLAQLVAPVARRQQRGGDRAGGRAGDVLRGEAPLLEHRERAREADALDPAALEDEIGGVLMVVSCGLSASHRGPHRRGSSLHCASGGEIMQRRAQLCCGAPEEAPWPNHFVESPHVDRTSGAESTDRRPHDGDGREGRDGRALRHGSATRPRRSGALPRSTRSLDRPVRPRLKTIGGHALGANHDGIDRARRPRQADGPRLERRVLDGHARPLRGWSPTCARSTRSR